MNGVIGRGVGGIITGIDKLLIEYQINYNCCTFCIFVARRDGDDDWCCALGQVEQITEHLFGCCSMTLDDHGQTLMWQKYHRVKS